MIQPLVWQTQSGIGSQLHLHGQLGVMLTLGSGSNLGDIPSTLGPCGFSGEMIQFDKIFTGGLKPPTSPAKYESLGMDSGCFLVVRNVFRQNRDTHQEYRDRKFPWNSSAVRSPTSK